MHKNVLRLKNQNYNEELFSMEVGKSLNVGFSRIYEFYWNSFSNFQSGRI